MNRFRCLMNSSAVWFGSNSRWTALVKRQANNKIYVFPSFSILTFKPKAEYVPGKELVPADALSRNPLSNPPETSDTEEDVKVYVDTAKMMRPVSMAKLESIKSAISSDPQLSHVLDYTVNGWSKYA